MKTLELNQQEQIVLIQVLEQCMADLSHEIHYTDHGEFKQLLRERQTLIAGVVSRLSESHGHAVAA